MKRSLIHLLIFAVLSAHINANSNGLSADRNNVNFINKISRKIRSTSANISHQTVNENEKRAVLLWHMKDFIKLSLDLHMPFDEAAQRGKVVYSRLAAMSEETKIADVLVDVPKTQIELLIKRFENQSLISRNQFQHELSQNFFIRQTWRQFQGQYEGQFICGSVSFVDTSASQGESKGSIAYAFVKLHYNQNGTRHEMTDQESSDLMVYLKTAVILYHHEKNGPKLLSLQTEQIGSEDDLPDHMKRDTQQANKASPN